MPASFLALLTIGSVALLLFLIIRCKMQAFVALLLMSITVALLGGVPLGEVTSTLQQGMGNTLGYIAIVIGLGTMIGEILRASGGAAQIANTLMRKTGEDKASWGLTAVGLIVAIPVFFEVALLLFIPLVYNLTRRTNKSILYYGIPLVAGIAVAHSFIPPTPGPVAVASLLGADLGWVILIGSIAGVPAAIVGGVIWGKYISAKLPLIRPEHLLAKAAEQTHQEGTQGKRAPSFAMAISIIAAPLLLIVGNTLARTFLPQEELLTQILMFIGHPFCALLIAFLLASYFMGSRLGFSREEIQGITSRSLEPVGMIILLTGAGGVFGRVLVTTGVGDALVEVMQTASLPLVLFGFLIATVIRVSQGSATVAMVTTAGLLAPILGMGDHSPALTAALVIAIACGATVLSHVNDSGFWLVKELMGLTEKQTLLSWTLMVTIIGLTGLAVILLLSLFV